MLKQLRIHDFQAHQKLVIDLDPRITTIVGASDTGKSAIVRALGLLCFNRPQGHAFVRHGGEASRVSLSFGKHRIVRTRGKGTNTYHLDGRELKAFGTDVPDEVRRLLRVSEHNFQFQLDPPFWFSSSGPEVSRALNAVVGLNVMDEVMSKIARAKRDAKLEETVAERELEKVTEELEALKDVGEMFDEVEDLRTLDDEIVNLSLDIQELEKCVDQIGYAKTTIQQNAEMVDELDSIVRNAHEVMRESRSYAELSRALEDLTNIEGQVDGLASDKRRAEAELAKVKTCPLCGTPLRKGHEHSGRNPSR